ncbi:hypothetical protein [Actinomyces vulturis]|uniref:hypothetical protein n=1 Tax=Actinomyces vulturis TaxID=1857645 RepID=UPI00082FBA1C|nr:hypothetical protein [Actinomyces vulturis]
MTRAALLIALPGALPSSLAEVVAERGGVVFDVESHAARALGVPAELAVAYVGQERWIDAHRQVLTDTLQNVQSVAVHRENATALTRSDDAQRMSPRSLECLVVVPSLVVEDEECCELIRSVDLPIVGLTGTPRKLAHAIGLSAPRSIALGPVFSTFATMCERRETALRDICHEVLVIDEASDDSAAWLIDVLVSVVF